jgi:hypothetical protein
MAVASLATRGWLLMASHLLSERILYCECAARQRAVLCFYYPQLRASRGTYKTRFPDHCFTPRWDITENSYFNASGIAPGNRDANPAGIDAKLAGVLADVRYFGRPYGVMDRVTVEEV